jgi:hypothetical protein
VADVSRMGGDNRLAQFREAEELSEQTAAVAQSRLGATGVEPEPHQPHELARLARQRSHDGPDVRLSIIGDRTKRGLRQRAMNRIGNRPNGDKRKTMRCRNAAGDVRLHVDRNRIGVGPKRKFGGRQCDESVAAGDRRVDRIGMKAQNRL